MTPTLLVETARGCWWGERSHCTFCGLNGATMTFRSKSPERVVEEFTHLRDRYGVRSFSVVDDILDMQYFKTVVPMLAEAELGLELFWEIKANLTARHVRELRDAGVIWVQPGVESLNDHVLDLMRKGTTAFKNIELLKWCKEYGVKPLWNFLYGFPGETADDYAESIELIHSIWHLDAPTGYGPVRLDRFSPYHQDPEGFGMTNVRPMAPFTILYPFDVETVMEIAYYFEFDYADDRVGDTFAHDAVELVRTWMNEQWRGHALDAGAPRRLALHRGHAADDRRRRRGRRCCATGRRPSTSSAIARRRSARSPSFRRSSARESPRTSSRRSSSAASTTA